MLQNIEDPEETDEIHLKRKLIEQFEDSLYVIGGHDGNQSLSSVEILDHPSAQWRPGPSLTTPRLENWILKTNDGMISERIPMLS